MATELWILSTLFSKSKIINATSTRRGYGSMRDAPPASCCLAVDDKDFLAHEMIGALFCWFQVGLPNVGKSTFFNILTKVGSCAGNSRLAVKKIKGEKDPNKPTRPRALSSSSCESQSWFLVRFVLLLWDNFRKEYKEKHPGVKLVSVIGKAGGEKWKSMSDALENEKHAGALLLHTSGTVSGAVVLLEATDVMAALYGGEHKPSIHSIWLLCDVDILSNLKLLIFFVLTLSLMRGKL
ncbi:uncharacterized protein [Triticum aestivum]|uniref:uncharacterized protein n=1 Tax=Triticum aestivum TaxID=4565 RepID=UPI001D02EBBD|nr:uncharacterized protein LOC123067967 [Triticum aestivum]